MLQRVYPEVAQNAAGQGTESGAAGLSCRYNYDMDSKRTRKAEKEIMKLKNVLIVVDDMEESIRFYKEMFGLQVIMKQEGNVILSEEANEKGPMLINILGWMIENTGNTIDHEILSSSPKAESNIDFLTTLKHLQSSANKIRLDYDLSFEDFSYSCAVATAFVITQCKDDLSIESGFNTAIYGFIEGTKTMPPEFGSQEEQAKWYQFWKK